MIVASLQVLVHGEASVMGRLRAALQSQFADTETKIHTPRNVEPLTLTFHTERVVKVSFGVTSKLLCNFQVSNPPSV